MYHVTRQGETLYSIGWAYGYDYRQLAKWNKIPAPYALKPGQRLRVAPHAVTGKLTVSWSGSKETRNNAVTKVVKQNALHPLNHPVKSLIGPKKSVAQASPAVWYWPTKQGKVIQRYHAHEPGKRGLQLSGLKGQAIFSAAGGRVVYSGSGLARYGKLIIVKHNDTFLSAYAHNRRLLVKEGERIRAGQKIAEMGSTGTNRVKLHFEIRRNGKPVDPLRYLPKQMP